LEVAHGAIASSRSWPRL